MFRYVLVDTTKNEMILPTQLDKNNENAMPLYTQEEKSQYTTTLFDYCDKTLSKLPPAAAAEKFQSFFNIRTPKKFTDQILNKMVQKHDHLRRLWANFFPGRSSKKFNGDNEIEKKKAAAKANTDASWRTDTLNITLAFLNWHYKMLTSAHSLDFHQRSSKSMLAEIKNAKK